MSSRSMRIRVGQAILTWALFCLTAAVAAQGDQPAAPNSADIEFFETKVRPLLARHCYQCHSGTSKSLKGGLRLDQRSLLLKGGDSGSVVLPGKPDQSLLIKAVRWESLEMPPTGRLKKSEIQALHQWVQMGAPWPTEATAGSRKPDSEGYDWDMWRQNHWAFRPLQKPTPPDIGPSNWVRSDLDRFVLARLKAAGLEPAPLAEPRVLVRRIHFDLIGLPPTPDRVESFIESWNRDSGLAVENLVNELLGSPQYGERWARHWLDVARYSDGYGGFLDNTVFSQAWRFRDWVVNALNSDLPFNRFVELQIAGDLVGDRSDAVATGFFALGPSYRSDGGDPDSVAQAKAETLSDRLDTLGRGMLGLTLACARCHDHKFDPIPQQDYYSLAGIFNNTAIHEVPLAPSEVVQTYHDHQNSIQSCSKQIKDLQNLVKKEKRKASSEEERRLAELNRKLSELRSSAPAKYDFVHGLRENGSTDMKIAIRGDLRKPGDPAPRRFIQILSDNHSDHFLEGSGRKQLAAAVSERSNSLTPRVFVNRVWMHHFGHAIVRTPSNFGALGEKPTHPQLLDWLTTELIESSYSIKSLHRTIMLSSTYLMASDFDSESFRKDGDNRLIWRMNPRRLDVEAWRDSILNVTGELQETFGGPPTDRVESPRRTLYFKVSRNGDVFATDKFLRRFDFPLMRATVDHRPSSIVPQQFLFLLNSSFMVQRARALVTKLAESSTHNSDRIRSAYLLLYQRPASSEEIKIGLAFLEDAATTESKLSPWTQYAQVLLSANELMYVR